MTDKTKKVLDAKKTEHEDRIYSYEIYINDSDETIESIEISMFEALQAFNGLHLSSLLLSSLWKTMNRRNGQETPAS